MLDLAQPVEGKKFRAFSRLDAARAACPPGKTQREHPCSSGEWTAKAAIARRWPTNICELEAPASPILLPPGIVDYVIGHEFAHVHVPDHSQKFWGRVERVMPDYQECRRRLGENGARYDC